MRRVVVESPFAAKRSSQRRRNIFYAQRAMRDCLLRGEAPIASHLLYAHDSILNDEAPNERALGIEAGLVWAEIADATVVYIDHGISAGMQRGIDHAVARGRPVEHRRLIKTELPKP